MINLCLFLVHHSVGRSDMWGVIRLTGEQNYTSVDGVIFVGGGRQMVG